MSNQQQQKDMRRFRGFTNDQQKQRREGSVYAEAARSVQQASRKPGSVDVPGVVLNMYQMKSQKSVATGGQSGGGGTGVNSPPVIMSFKMSVEGLAANHIDGAEYVIVDSKTIKFPSYDGDRLKMITTLLKALKPQLKALQDKKAPVEEIDAVKLQIAKAEADYEEANRTVIDWIFVRDGETHDVKMFTVNGAFPEYSAFGDAVLAGVYARSTFYQGEYRPSLYCSKMVSMGVVSGQLVINKWMKQWDIISAPLVLPDLSKNGGRTVVVAYFDDYARQWHEEEDEEELQLWNSLSAEEREKRGLKEPPAERYNRSCVVTKMMQNATSEEAFLIPVKDQESKIKAIYSMSVSQDESESDLGFPAGNIFVSALFLEGNWTAEEQNKGLLRSSIGINNASKFAAMMTANPIPALVAISVMNQETATANAGLEVNSTVIPEGKTGNIIGYGNAAVFDLWGYLRKNCMRVSPEWVRRFMGLSPTDPFQISKEIPNRVNRLNKDNVEVKGHQRVLKPFGVVCVSEYTGSLEDLGGEFRVMINVPLSPEDRFNLSQLDPKDAEKVLGNREDAVFQLPQEGVQKYVYAVKPPTPEEEEEMEACRSNWRKRKADAAKVEAQRQKDWEEAAIKAEEEALALAAAGANCNAIVRGIPKPTAEEGDFEDGDEGVQPMDVGGEEQELEEQQRLLDKTNAVSRKLFHATDEDGVPLQSQPLPEDDGGDDNEPTPERKKEEAKKRLLQSLAFDGDNDVEDGEGEAEQHNVPVTKVPSGSSKKKSKIAATNGEDSSVTGEGKKKKKVVTASQTVAAAASSTKKRN